MRLVFAIFKYYPFGGLERNFIRIAEECLSRGHSIDILTMRWDGEVPKLLRSPKCVIEKIPSRGLSNHARCASFASNLSKSLEKRDFDLLVGFNRMPGLDLYYCADVCYVDDVRRRRSFLHRLTPRYKIYSSFEKAVFSPNSETAILALSDIQRDIYMKEYGTQQERFFPVPAGIDKAYVRSGLSPAKRTRIREELRVGKDENLILMVGSDYRRKGVDRSIKALAALPSALLDKTRLVIAGKGRPAAFEKLASGSGMSSKTIFLGPVSDVPALLGAADLLAHPARSENTGNAIAEALIAGVPVLTLSNCGYAFHVEKSGAGAVLDGWNFSQEEFNAKLADLLDANPERKAKWRESALRYSDDTDFYSRPQAVANIIEKLALKKKY